MQTHTPHTERKVESERDYTQREVEREMCVCACVCVRVWGMCVCVCVFEIGKGRMHVRVYVYLSSGQCGVFELGTGRRNLVTLRSCGRGLLAFAPGSPPIR